MALGLFRIHFQPFWSAPEIVPATFALLGLMFVFPISYSTILLQLEIAQVLSSRWVTKRRR